MKFYLKDRIIPEHPNNNNKYEVEEIIEVIKELITCEKNNCKKEVYIPSRINHGIQTEDVNQANWQLWCNHFAYDVIIEEE